MGLEPFVDVYNEFDRLSGLVGKPFISNPNLTQVTEYITVCNLVLNGEITDYNDPRIVRIRDGWSENTKGQEVAVDPSDLEEKIRTLQIEAVGVNVDEAVVREKLRTYAKVFPAHFMVLGRKLRLCDKKHVTKDSTGSYHHSYGDEETHDRNYTELLWEVDDSGNLLDEQGTIWTLLHEGNHAVDINPQIKRYVSREAYLRYMREYLYNTGNLIENFLNNPVEDQADLAHNREFLPQGYELTPPFDEVFIRQSAQSLYPESRHTELLKEDDTYSKEALTYIAHYAANRARQIQQRIVQGQEIPEEEREYLKEYHRSELGDVLISTVTHLLVNPQERNDHPSNYSQVPVIEEDYIHTPLARARKNVEVARYTALSTLPHTWTYSDFAYRMGITLPKDKLSLISPAERNRSLLENTVGLKPLLHSEIKEIGGETDIYEIGDSPDGESKLFFINPLTYQSGGGSYIAYEKYPTNGFLVKIHKSTFR